MDGCPKSPNDLVLLASGESQEEWIGIELDGLEVPKPAAPVASLLLSGVPGNCIEAGKFFESRS